MRAKLHIWWQKMRQHPFIVRGLIVILIVAIIFALLVYRFGWDWTGFNTYSIIWQPTATKGTSLPITSIEEKLPYKTLWDWLQLLGVLTIPVVVVWFTYTLQQRDKRLEKLQRDRDQELERKQREIEREAAENRARLEREAADKRAQVEQEAAEKRAQTEREIALDNQQEAALQAYFDRMSELLLKENLLKAQRGSEICTIARLRTTSVIRGLDPRRKGYVLRFVYGAGLIKIDDPIIELNSAKFSEVNLRVTSLKGVSIIEANFWKAILSGAELNGDFHGTTFDESNLIEATLVGDFQETSFNGADLRFAGLVGDFTRAKFIRANLEGATLGQTQLCYANLSYANLAGVDFRSVNLEGAILKGAINVTDDQLNEAYQLQGAVMPDGKIHP